MEVPLFFSGFLVEFLGSNEEGMGVGAYIEEGTLSPEPPPAAEPPRRADRGPDRNFFLQKRHVAQAGGDRPDRGPVAYPMGDSGPFL